MIKVISHIVVGSLLLPVCFAQEPGGQEQPPAPGNQQPGGGRPQPGSQPNGSDRTQQPQQFPDAAPRPIYLSGSVRLADGSPPPAGVMIERVCNGVARPEAYADSKGNFSLMVGGQMGTIIPDASVGNDPFSRDPGFGGLGGERGVNVRDLMGCEIRGNLAGFQSNSIMLTFRQALDDPDIGIIYLRRMANVDGFTFSATTAAAPKNARSAYENGIAHMKKQKWPDAERELLKAVQNYPKYAVAWYELGRSYQQQKKLEDAIRAHTEAVNIDSKYISPLGELAVMALVQQKWDGAVLHTSQIFKLNPHVSPDIYFYSAIANYNMQNADVAETHAREAASLDTQHRNPKINHLLGMILADKRDYKGAAENLRMYLNLSPKAPDAAAVNQVLADVERAASQQAPKPNN